MMFRALGLLAILAASTASAAPIIGGTATTPSDFPAVPLLEIGNALCTGTLIAPDWVMTAAHCLDPAVLGAPDQATVTARTKLKFGTVDQAHGAFTLRHADQTLVDPEWDHTHFGKHDLGLIHMTADADAPAVTPLAINFKNSRAPIGVTVTMVGFGETSVNASSAGVEYALANQKAETCDHFKVGGGATLEDDDLLCFTQAHGMGTCEGDSGGPLIAMIGGAQTVIGVTSFGDMACADYGAYTRTDAEIDFISATIPELCVGDACVDDRAAGGCCDASGRGAPTALLGAAIVGLVVRRRRRA